MSGHDRSDLYYFAHRGEQSLSFRLVSESADQLGIFALRQEVYEGISEYLLGVKDGIHPGADQFDAKAYLFCCYQEGEAVASCRFTPRLTGGWELNDLTLPRFPSVDLERLLQVSRVVVRPDMRRLHFGEVMMYFSCVWFLHYTRYKDCFAICRPPLARYYRHFGMTVLSRENVVLEKRAGNRYLFIHGEFVRCAAYLRRYLTENGWELSPDEGGESQPAIKTDLALSTL